MTAPDPKPMNEKPSETPRTEAAKVGAEWIIASHSAGDFVRAAIAETLELETQSLTRRLAEAEKSVKADDATILRLIEERNIAIDANTALRTAADGLAAVAKRIAVYDITGIGPEARMAYDKYSALIAELEGEG